MTKLHENETAEKPQGFFGKIASAIKKKFSDFKLKLSDNKDLRGKFKSDVGHFSQNGAKEFGHILKKNNIKNPEKVVQTKDQGS